MARRKRLNDQVWRNLKKRLNKRQPHVKVGVLAARGGNATHESGITLVELAAIHEFGSTKAGIPERSFIRRAFRTNRKELQSVLEKLARRVMPPKGKRKTSRGTLTMDQALGVLGQWGSNLVKQTITSGTPIPPPLKPATIEKKGSDRPLVDTGRLVGSINYEVKT